MDDDSYRSFERATRVQTFGRHYVGDIALGCRIAMSLTDLDIIVEKLTTACVGKQALIEVFSEDFKDIARIERAPRKAKNPNSVTPPTP